MLLNASNSDSDRSTSAMPKKPFINIPPIDAYTSRKEWEGACWKKILESKDELGLIITSFERRNIVLRAAAIDRLFSGKSYRKIGEELWLSPQTISGIQKALKENGYKSHA